MAAPVFKEVADKLMAADPDPGVQPVLKKDSAQFYYAGASRDLRQVARTVGLPYADSAGKNEWAHLYGSDGRPVLNRETVSRQTVPDVKGMGLKDALYLLENMDLRVAARGKGKVRAQSIQPGTALTRKQTIELELD